MLPDWVSKYKEKGTEIKLIKGHYYKYGTTYKYDPVRKRSVRLKTKILGSITEKGFVKSEKTSMRKALENPDYDTKQFGPFAIFQTLLSDEISSLIDVFGQQTAERILSFALARWAFCSPIKRVSLLYSQSFCSEVWCKDDVINDKTISETLKFIGANRNKVIQWLKKLLPNTAEHLILLDSTHFFSASEHVTINEIGYNPDGIFDKQIRLMYMFSGNFKRPVYFRPFNGNITDVSAMEQSINEMDVHDVVIIADKGFYSLKNINDMKEQHLQHVVPVPRNNECIDYTPFINGDYECHNKYFLYQKRVVWFHEYEYNKKKYVTFLDEKLRGEERQSFFCNKEAQLAKQPLEEQDFEEVFTARKHTFGTLTLTYDFEKSHTAQEIYEIYKQRNEIEVMFSVYKTFLKADKSYMQNRYVLEGWLFVNFIAMLAYFKLFDRLREEKLVKKMSPADVLHCAQGIYQNYNMWTKQWVRTEMTKKSRELFKKLRIDPLI